MPDLLFSERDPFSPIKYSYEIQGVLYSGGTKDHEIAILESAYFGRMLAIDNVVQLTERDEHFYHEMLVHVPLHAHSMPRKVLIIGGGDGGTLREVLKHQTVEKVQVVEIAQEVIDVSRRFLPTVSVGFSDPRVYVVIQDGAKFITDTEEKYDVVIVDCTDPVGDAESLFTSQFFSNIFSALTCDGILVIQTESLHFHRELVRDIQIRLANVFPMVDLYTVPLATYAGNWWTFSIASKRYNARDLARPCQVDTKYYAEDVHSHSFLPQSILEKLKAGEMR